MNYTVPINLYYKYYLTNSITKLIYILNSIAWHFDNFQQILLLKLIIIFYLSNIIILVNYIILHIMYFILFHYIKYYSSVVYKYSERNTNFNSSNNILFLIKWHFFSDIFTTDILVESFFSQGLFCKLLLRLFLWRSFAETKLTVKSFLLRTSKYRSINTNNDGFFFNKILQTYFIETKIYASSILQYNV